MVNSKTTFDLTNRQEAARVLPCAPLIDSYHAGWKGLTFTHYCHPPHRTIEHRLLQHSLVISDTECCFQLERHFDGKHRTYAHGNGRVDIIPAFADHWTNWDREIKFSVIAIWPTLLSQTAEDFYPGEIELIPQFSVEDPIVKQLAIALQAEIQTGCMSGRLYGEALGTAIAARLVQNYAVNKPVTKLKVNELSRSQLSQVIDYIRENLSQNLSISDLATLTSMSESHFSRSFKQSVGIPPYQYLIQQRVERAKQLLKQSSKSISNIALDCGFANQTHLTKVFHKMTGATPSAYRKQ